MNFHYQVDKDKFGIRELKGRGKLGEQTKGLPSYSCLRFTATYTTAEKRCNTEETCRDFFCLLHLYQLFSLSSDHFLNADHETFQYGNCHTRKYNNCLVKTLEICDPTHNEQRSVTLLS